MKRVCAAWFAALVIFLPSFTAARERALLTLPIPVEVRLCESDASCRSESLAAGASLRGFVDTHASPTRSYRLELTLPPGDVELQRSWIIEGDALPPQVTRLSIAGSRFGTRLNGLRKLSAIGARIESAQHGVLRIELPRSLRAELRPSDRYTGEDPAWPQLYDARGALRLTRWPREGWAAFSQSAAAADSGSIQLAGDAPFASWHDEEFAWVSGFFKFGWHSDYAPLRGVDADAAALRLGGQTRYGIGKTGRFRVLNLRSELREEGDYWIDTARGHLYARPRAGARPAELGLTALTTPLMHVRNARAIEIAGISFAHTRGHGLMVENSHDIELSALSFEGIGRAGVVVDGGRNVRLRSSTFENLGDQAVILRGGERASLTTSGHRVEDCHIRRPSQRLNTPATAIRLEGVGHVVRNNTIEATPHSAVYFDGNDHVIEGNWIERTCLEVDDAGAIYAGRDWTARGTFIHGNVFKDIHSAPTNSIAVAIYLDDMLSGIHIENNAFADVDYGILVGGGRDNRIVRNFFLRTRTTLHVDERARTWAQRAVARGEVMEQRLNAMPVRGARWSAAYPRLAAMSRDRAAIPEGNEIRENVAAESGAPAVVPIAANTGSVEAPRALSLPPNVRTAIELLQFCRRSANCRPFEPPPMELRPHVAER